MIPLNRTLNRELRRATAQLQHVGRSAERTTLTPNLLKQPDIVGVYTAFLFYHSGVISFLL